MKIRLREFWNSLMGSPATTTPLRTSSGIDLEMFCSSTDAAMKVAAVYSAVKLIGEGVARLALSYQRYNSARSCFVNDYDSPLYIALRLCPNRYMTSFDMWRASLQQVLLRGNAYLVPAKDKSGEVPSLTLVSPDCCVFDICTKTYTVTDAVNSINRVYRPEEIVHLRNIGLDGGYTGVSTVQYMAQTLGIIRLSDQNTANTLSNGGRMRGILSGNAGANVFADATTEQLKSVSNVVEENIRAGKTVIPVPSDMKFQPITLSPADAKVLESKQTTIRDVARFFRVHPSLLYEDSNNTYKAAEVPNVMFLTQTLEPLLAQIEAELLVKLVPRELWGRRRIRFDREALYTTDLQTEANYFEKMLQTGVYTVNELRVKKGQAPIEGGDTPLVSANLKGLDVLLQENTSTLTTTKNGQEN
jgi:HK97 family phage portal protein